MKKKSEKKENKLYTGIYIILIILISIAYASLAENLGVKVTKGTKKDVIIEEPVIEEPVIEEPVIEEPTPDSPKKPTPKPPKKDPEPKPPENPTPDPTPEPDPEPDPPIIIDPPVEPSDIDWIIEFENIKELSGSVTPVSKATIDSSKMNINFSIVLNKPGQYYSFTADIANKGNTDAKIYNIIESGLTARQRKFLIFNVKYNDGTTISPEDTLLKGEKKKIKVLVKFKNDEDGIEAEDLPQTQQVLDLQYHITYVQK